MKKGFLLTVPFVVFAFQAFGQVGVGTVTPTELLDINGTLRIRNLPINGTTNTIHTTGENTSTDTPTVTFNATYMVVLDANGVLGTVPGLPTTSNTITWNSGGGNFPRKATPSTSGAMSFGFKSLSVSFIRPSGSGDTYQFHIKSPVAGKYISDIRQMTTTSATYHRANATLAADTWVRIAGSTDYTLATSWHVNIWLESIDRVYRITVMSVNPGSSNKSLTVNIQEL